MFNRSNSLKSFFAGVFLCATPIILVAACFQDATYLETGNSPRSIAVGDFNSDGNPDLAVVDVSDSVNIFLGNGDGTFRSPSYFVVSGHLEVVVTGDFNQDGILDLAVADTYYDDLYILIGTGNGWFNLQQQNYPITDEPISMLAEDFNGDKNLDLAIGAGFGHHIWVLFGNGDGTFRKPLVLYARSEPETLASADFNEDGNIDIVAANNGRNDVSVFLNNGDGLFKEDMIFRANGAPESIGVADFNLDGRIDLAVGTSFGSNLSVLLGNGDGSFERRRLFAAGPSPISVAVADFNSDLNPDIVAANFATNGTISLLLGNGLGDFREPVSFAAGVAPFYVTTSDFNLDKLPDIAAANYFSGNVAIFINSCTQKNVVCDGSQLFCDDFEDGVLAKDWFYSKPDWVEEFGNLKGIARNGINSALATPAFAGCINCSVSTRMKLIGEMPGKAGFYGWLTDKNNKIEVTLKKQTNSISLRQVVNGIKVKKTKAFLRINSDQFYDVTVKFDGTTFTLYVDGAKVISMEGASAMSGTTGVYAANTTALFDSIVVN
jgi:hypothetical protein